MKNGTNKIRISFDNDMGHIYHATLVSRLAVENDSNQKGVTIE